MPFIRVSSAKPVPAEAEQALIDALGAALSAVPGKDPQWTMVELDAPRPMYFGGQKQADMVFLDTKYVGHFPFPRKRAYVRAACKAVHEILGTPTDRVCVTVSEYENWGALGDFRDINFPE